MYSERVKERERWGTQLPFPPELCSVSYADLYSKFFSISSMVACTDCSL